nr:TetR/AcrR family transcriptional regulator [Pseudenhygromyxa sp. WMMC2535]
MAELAELGFAKLTIEGVAKAAGVSRTTIYRRWPSKSELVAAAMEPLLAPYAREIDSGSLVEDLLALMEILSENLGRPKARELIRVLNDPSLREVARSSADRAFAAFLRVFEHAQARGEIGPEEDVEMICHLTVYGLTYWAEHHGRFPGEAERLRLLRVVLAPLPGIELPQLA